MSRRDSDRTDPSKWNWAWDPDELQSIVTGLEDRGWKRHFLSADQFHLHRKTKSCLVDIIGQAKPCCLDLEIQLGRSSTYSQSYLSLQAPYRELLTSLIETIAERLRQLTREGWPDFLMYLVENVPLVQCVEGEDGEDTWTITRQKAKSDPWSALS